MDDSCAVATITKENCNIEAATVEYLVPVNDDFTIRIDMNSSNPTNPSVIEKYYSPGDFVDAPNGTPAGLLTGMHIGSETSPTRLRLS